MNFSVHFDEATLVRLSQAVERFGMTRNRIIVTAVQEGLKLTIVLVDNHGFGCIHGLQRGCGGNSFGNEFRRRNARADRLEGEFAPVDFVKNAESLGATAVRANA